MVTIMSNIVPEAALIRKVQMYLQRCPAKYRRHVMINGDYHVEYYVRKWS